MSELATRSHLVPFLITQHEGGMTNWFGVSAYSRADAFALLHRYGYELDPEDARLGKRERPVLSAFEERHLGPNMGSAR